jgi:predicted nucleic acid-binding protein
LPILFDTDVLIWFLRGEPAAAKLIDATADREISIISVMEVIQGAQSKPETKTIMDLFAKTEFRIVPLSETIGHAAAGLIQQYTHAHGIDVADALIAATAMGEDAILVTGNVRHFRAIRGLKVQVFRPRQR